jgi:FemAB-related protein (PEP-CTERM system-associated)
MREEFNEDWDEFVLGHPESTFFHLWGWRDVLGESFGYKPYYLCVEEAGELAGILPLFLVRSYLFGKSLITIPLGMYGGPIAKNQRAEQSLLKAAEELLEAKNARYLEIRGNPYRATELSLRTEDDRKHYARKDLYVTFIGEMASDPGANLAQIPRKQRRMVRQGQKHGLRVTFENDRLREWYAVYAASVRNLGTPVYSYKYFQKLLTRFQTQCKILLVQYERNIIAGVFSFFFKDQVLPYYGGALREYFHLAPNDFMYWELLSYGAANNYRIFDFGRSKQGTGSFDFKRHWGFQPRPLTYWYRSGDGHTVPDTSPLNPKLQWAIRMWKNLPLPVTMGLGPVISRHLP